MRTIKITMQVTPIQTDKFYPGDDLLSFIKEALPTLAEESIVVVTSKIVSLAENRVVPVKSGTKQEKLDLARQEADYYIDESHSQFNLLITIRDHLVAVNAGLDQSNVEGHYLLLPKKPQESATRIWHYLREAYDLEKVGVIITDSKTIPLKWGTMGASLAYCGFQALVNKVGQPDLFGRSLEMTKVNVAEGLAAAAVVEMGEVAEAQPLAVITGANQAIFQDHPPTEEELAETTIELEDDVYGPMLTAAPWIKNHD